MVLSMLSAIQNVKLPASTSPAPVNTNLVNINQENTNTKKQEEQQQHSHSTTRAAGTDMSRRKQRNPKPIFNPADNENDQELSIRPVEDFKNSKETSEDELSIHEDLHSMVKVELHETNPNPESPINASNPPICTPPPSTSGSGGVMPSLSRIPTMPPLHLPPNPASVSGIRTPNPEQMMMNHTAEMLAKQNMFCFGDVTVAEHPDAPPVPMVIPMVYLYPLPTPSKENIKYRMFVPLGGGLGPELLVPNPPPSLPPSVTGNMTGNSSTPTKLPKLEQAKSRAESSDSGSSAGSGTEGPTRRSGETTPLDLSKSPDSLNNSHINRSESIAGSDTEGESSILPDQRHLPPPLRRASTLMKEAGNRAPGTGSTSPVSDDQLKSREIEVQLQFLKAKQLEFLKDQHQKQAVALAAAQAAAVAAQQKSRCEECNINFSKHQNYIAHKKYYCSAASGAAGSIPNVSGPSVGNKSGLGGPGQPPLPILSDNDDDKSSDDGKSQSHRKLSPPIASPALMLTGLTSPTLKDRKDGSDIVKDQLLSNKEQSASLISSATTELKSQQISPGLLIPPPGITTTPSPLPHFVCEGCGIKFKSVSNLQAHQARYCAGLRKASEEAFEAMLLKQKQAQQQSAVLAAAAQQQQNMNTKANQQAAAASLPMLEMMSLLNAKSNAIDQNEKLSSLMMSSMAAAAMQAAANANNNSPSGTQSNGSSAAAGNGTDDYCCILCGYKEQSVERLKDHINLHFIGQVKRKHDSDSESTNGGGSNPDITLPSELSQSGEPSVKKMKVKIEQVDQPQSTDLPLTVKSAPLSPNNNIADSDDNNPTATPPGGQLKCNSCEIGFSHLSNFVAHKKYYCRGLPSGMKSSASPPSVDVKVGTNGKESPTSK